MADEQERWQVQRQHSQYYLRLLAAQEEPLQRQQQRTALDIIRSDFGRVMRKLGFRGQFTRAFFLARWCFRDRTVVDTRLFGSVFSIPTTRALPLPAS
ncbi:MAG: hypothetical protein HC778_05290, partial [Chamaesiphon sp. CSU_1_12]|nr:hypothetical protein [Chamaesiphon sp. CSU_1_12]